MTYFLQFCGVIDPLQLFYLEQRNLEPQASTEADVSPMGPAFGGFRPFELDRVLTWAQEIARGRRWDGEAIQRTVVDAWMDRAEVIRQWQVRLREEPSDRLLVAAIGTPLDWSARCERMMRG